MPRWSRVPIDDAAKAAAKRIRPAGFEVRTRELGDAAIQGQVLAITADVATEVTRSREPGWLRPSAGLEHFKARG